MQQQASVQRSGCCVIPGARYEVHTVYRADWGQSVRTEHHLAPPDGSRGGASNGLNSYLDLASVGRIVTDFLLPVPRRYALR